MADITDPRVIKFMNERVRPLAEKIYALQVELDSMETSWTNEVQPIISAAASGDLIEDGRFSEGVSRLTKADAVSFLQVVNSIKTNLDSVDSNVVWKPTVRRSFLNALGG